MIIHKLKVNLITYDRIKNKQQLSVLMDNTGRAVQKGERLDFYCDESDELGKRVGGIASAVTRVTNEGQAANWIIAEIRPLLTDEALIGHGMSQGASDNRQAYEVLGFASVEDCERDLELDGLIAKVRSRNKPSVKDQANLKDWLAEKAEIQDRKTNVR